MEIKQEAPSDEEIALAVADMHAEFARSLLREVASACFEIDRHRRADRILANLHDDTGEVE